MSHEKKRRDSELSLLLRLPPKSGNLSSTGRKGVCGKPGKGVLHEDDPHFSELFEALKNACSVTKKIFRHAAREGQASLPF